MVFIPSTPIEYNSSHPWQGILKYIRTHSGFNDPHSEGVVKVSSSSTSTGSITTPITVDSDAYDHWGSSNTENQWYQVDFQQNRVAITSYTYRAWDGDFFSEWNIFGSDDGFHWEILHHQTQFQRPSGGHHTLHFTVNYTRVKRIVRFSPKYNRFS